MQLCNPTIWESSCLWGVWEALQVVAVYTSTAKDTPISSVLSSGKANIVESCFQEDKTATDLTWLPVHSMMLFWFQRKSKHLTLKFGVPSQSLNLVGRYSSGTNFRSHPGAIWQSATTWSFSTLETAHVISWPCPARVADRTNWMFLSYGGLKQLCAALCPLLWHCGGGRARGANLGGVRPH